MLAALLSIVIYMHDALWSIVIYMLAALLSIVIYICEQSSFCALIMVNWVSINLAQVDVSFSLCVCVKVFKRSESHIHKKVCPDFGAP